jgi:tetratricopeptide (TPR) repeat protein
MTAVRGSQAVSVGILSIGFVLSLAQTSSAIPKGIPAQATAPVPTPPSPATPAPSPPVSTRAQLVQQLIARADEYTHQGRWEAALGLYQDAYQEQPDPSLLLAIGLCHVSLNHPDDAQAKCDAFEQATPQPSPEQSAKLSLCRRGTFAARKAQLGKRAFDARNYEAARQAFESAYVIHKEPGFQLDIAKCYEAEGRWAEMLDRCQVFERSLEHPSEQDVQDAKDCKATAQYQLDRQGCLDLVAERSYPRAISACQSVFEVRQEPPLILRVGIAQAELKQFSAAQQSCNQYAALRPSAQRLVEDAALLDRCQQLVSSGLAAIEKQRLDALPKPWYKRKATWILAGAGAVAIGLTVGLSAGLTPQPYREFTW